MNIPPVAPIPNFRAGERHEDRAKPRRQAATGHRALTGSLPSAEYDTVKRDDDSDLGHHTDRTV